MWKIFIMKKKILLSFFCISILGQSLFAQADYRVLPTGSDTLLNKYLTGIMHDFYARRKSRLDSAMQSMKELKRYQKAILKSGSAQYYRKQKSKVEITDIIEQNSYRIEKIILGKTIPLNLYLPKTRGTHPAVLFLCGHEITGKSAESYQKTAILLAQNGFVVMVPDPISQGELIQLLDPNGKSLTRSATTEHTLINMQSTLCLGSFWGVEFYFNTLCLNYLCSRREVDDERIGCVGNSGGGTQLTYLSALDDRIKAVACCSFFTKRERMLVNVGVDDGCQYFPKEIKYGYEIADYYIKQAPRPTLILAGRKDFIDYQGVEEAFAELKQVYTLKGKSNDVQLVAVDDGHGISKPKREAAVQFFKTYLMNDDSSITEGDLTVLPDSVLRCTATGQILISNPKTYSTQKQILKKAVYLTETRNFDPKKKEKNSQKINELLAISPNLPSISMETVGQFETSNAIVKKIIVSRKGEPDMPLLLLTPKEGIMPEARVYVLLNDSGMVKDVTGERAEKLIGERNIVVLADPRGIGETKDIAEKNNKKFYSDDYRNAALSLMLGKPLLGQRVIDIFSVLDFIQLQPELSGKKISCLTTGNIGVAALHAKYLDSRISSMETRNCLSSWMDIILEPTGKNRMSLIVPGVLRYYDISSLKDE